MQFASNCGQSMGVLPKRVKIFRLIDFFYDLIDFFFSLSIIVIISICILVFCLPVQITPIWLLKKLSEDPECRTDPLTQALLEAEIHLVGPQGRDTSQ